jgi:hypothetical protein
MVVVSPMFLKDGVCSYAIGASGSSGAKDQAQQATLLTQMYHKLTSLPYVKGIWWYQCRDDSTGAWGLFNADGSARPSFHALASFVKHSSSASQEEAAPPMASPSAGGGGSGGIAGWAIALIVVGATAFVAIAVAGVVTARLLHTRRQREATILASGLAEPLMPE